MQLAVGLLASLSVIGLSQALATEATSPAATPQSQQSEASPAPSATPDATAAATSAATASAASTTTATTAATPPATTAAPERPNSKVTITGTKPGDDLTPFERKLLAAGYSLERHGDKKLFCQREETSGSMFARRTCQTSDAIYGATQHSKDTITDFQRTNAPTAQLPGR